jgi:hypothetical protein
MKKSALMLLCLPYLALSLFAQESEAPKVPAAPVPKGKETVAVYIAGKETKESQGMHSVLGGELVRAISVSGKYFAVDRTVQALAVLESEHAYQRGGAVRDEDVMALGKQLAARYLCVAEVKPVRGGSYYLNVRLIDVETAAAVASVTETSALEDIKEMRRVAQLLANQLVGNGGETAAAAAAAEPKPVEPAPDPVATRTRKVEAEAVVTVPSSENILENSNDAEENTRADGNVRPVVSPEFEPECGNGSSKIRYGGRLAFTSLFAGTKKTRGDGQELHETTAKSAGMFFSLGLTMNIPIASMLSLNPELLFDIRSMSLSVNLRGDVQELPLYKNDAMMEYVLSLPLVVRFEISRFYAEAGLRFDYPLVSDLDILSDEREQIDMGVVAGGGFTFGLSSFKCYLGYRFDGNATDFDKKGYIGFYRHSVGLTALF